jgi:hypothetical protein
MPGRKRGGGSGGGASSSAVRRWLGIDIGMDEGAKPECWAREWPKRPDLSSMYIAGGGPPGSLWGYRVGMSIMRCVPSKERSGDNHTSR